MAGACCIDGILPVWRTRGIDPGHGFIRGFLQVPRGAGAMQCFACEEPAEAGLMVSRM